MDICVTCEKFYLFTTLLEFCNNYCGENFVCKLRPSKRCISYGGNYLQIKIDAYCTGSVANSLQSVEQFMLNKTAAFELRHYDHHGTVTNYFRTTKL